MSKGPHLRKLVASTLDTAQSSFPEITNSRNVTLRNYFVISSHIRKGGLRLERLTFTVLSSALLRRVVTDPARDNCGTGRALVVVFSQTTVSAAEPRSSSLLMNTLVWAGVRPILQELN